MNRGERSLGIRYAALQTGYWMEYLIIFGFAAVFLMGRGFSASEIGYVTTVGTVLTILLQMALATLADRSQRITLKHILAALIIGCLAAATAMLLVPKSHIVTFVGMFTALSLTNAFSPLITSLCLKYNASGHHINFGVARGLGSLGFALASLAMGWLTEKLGSEIVLPLYCAIYALMLAVLLSMPRPAAAPEAAKSDAQTGKPTGLLQFFHRYRRYDVFLISVMLIFYLQMSLGTYMIYFVRSYGGGEAEMGTALFVAAFAEMPAVALGLTLLRRVTAQKLLCISALAGFVKSLTMLFIPNIGCFIGLQVIQFFFSGLYMVAAVYFADSIVAAADAVKAQAILAVGLTGVTGTASNIIGGYMLERLSVRSINLLGLILGLVGAALMFVATSPRFFKNEPDWRRLD